RRQQKQRVALQCYSYAKPYRTLNVSVASDCKQQHQCGDGRVEVVAKQRKINRGRRHPSQYSKYSGVPNDAVHCIKVDNPSRCDPKSEKPPYPGIEQMAQVAANREDDVGEERIFGWHFAIEAAALDDPAGRGKINADVVCIESQPDAEFFSGEIQDCGANKGRSCQEDAYDREKNLFPKFKF